MLCDSAKRDTLFQNRTQCRERATLRAKGTVLPLPGKLLAQA